MQLNSSRTKQIGYDKGKYQQPIRAMQTTTAMDNKSKTDAASEKQSAQQNAMLAECMQRIAEHQDKAAFAKLFAFFSPKIHSFGVQRLNQQGLAMDLVQETMTRVWTKAHLYNASKAAVSTWVFTIMRNQCFDMLRKVQHNREDAFGDDIWPLFESDNTSEEDDDFMLSASLLKHVEALPALQKQVVRGIYLQELTQQELAEKLQIPIGTVKSRLRLGLEKLKSFMEHQND
ncbi:sigma-70 family RNA polymerase sigma factor [Shewanella sp. WXL01]|uniref:sigma-70 family RNA polymerase sigma factor n=1 Tax=Shewanella sp. WXL01 TaxID=2709721 RepID=UPI0014382DA4|nr:sigma-70 family RNA polymerase sigma factor [Shewanella sp. WXL01]NKF51610.1 sigma-70 family RNA polymerase sigma factor [Shewanella sp. WXL01]